MRVTIQYVEFWVHMVCDMVRGADCYDFDDDWRKTLVCNQESTNLEWNGTSVSRSSFLLFHASGKEVTLL